MRVQFWVMPALAMMLAGQAPAATIFFSTGNPDGKLGAVTQPSSNSKIEVETGDDFVLTTESLITNATFTGLLVGGTNIGEVRVEIYRVFPNDSDVGRIQWVADVLDAGGTDQGQLAFGRGTRRSRYCDRQSVFHNVNARRHFHGV